MHDDHTATPGSRTPISTGRSWRDLPDAPPDDASSVSVGSTVDVDPAPVRPADDRDATLTNMTPPMVSPQTAARPQVPSPPTPPRRPATTSPWAWVAAGGLVLAVGLVALTAWAPWQTDTVDLAAVNTDMGAADDNAGSGTDDTAAGASGDTDAAIALAADQAAARLEGAVVAIAGPGGIGTGLALDEHRILTAAHIVATAPTAAVQFPDGTVAVAHVLGRDNVHDLAVVAVDTDLPAAPLAIGRPPAVGHLAIAVSVDHQARPFAEAGTIVESDPSVDTGLVAPEFLVYTDAPIDVSGWGGPLTDRSGEVVAVNVRVGSPRSDGVRAAMSIDAAVGLTAGFVDRPIELPPVPEVEDDSGIVPRGLWDFFGDLFGSGEDTVPVQPSTPVPGTESNPWWGGEWLTPPDDFFGLDDLYGVLPFGDWLPEFGFGGDDDMNNRFSQEEG